MFSLIISEEVDRHRKLPVHERTPGIRTVLPSDVREVIVGEGEQQMVSLSPADVQQLVVVKEEDPPEQQEWSSSLDQEDPEPPPHIKEEQEELWSSQEGEQLQGLEEADIIESTFTPVPVKSEHDEEKPQSSQLHQRQTEHMEGEADGEDCGGPDPERHLPSETDDNTEDSSEPETDDSDFWKESRERPSDLNSMENDQVPVRDSKHSARGKPFSCFQCGKRFSSKGDLKGHIITHTGEKPFSCSGCNQIFLCEEQLKLHIITHTRENSFSCSNCDIRFEQNVILTNHIAVHTRDKLFHCSVCNSDFSDSEALVQHMRIHTTQTQFSCPICSKEFAWRRYLTKHMDIHKIYSCSVCSKKFTRRYQLKYHQCVGRQSSKPHQSKTENEVLVSNDRCNTAEKPYSCSECGKIFGHKHHLKRHRRSHTGEKPFSCSICKKYFARRETLQTHMRIHSGEKPFNCSVCDKTFLRKAHLKRHMGTHTGEKPVSC
ncbi:hypothetical protein OYC64_003240 [Pagothenia borchgrevinki]|uniref:C2H2-type domain-containing protein n=1 Tax=Pagothenia borchgrevinki TaxID=8213 RepID=A0ABD2FP02_PAGBO